MNDYPYRQGVNAIVVDSQDNFLLVQKNSYDDTQWDFPGRGLDEGESLEEGILRELHEELGTDKFEIIKLSPLIIKFDWPQSAIDHGYQKHGKWWRGQEKHQFIVRFLGERSEIVFQQEELRQVKWVSYEKLKDPLIFPGQWENAERVLAEAGLK